MRPTPPIIDDTKLAQWLWHLANENNRSVVSTGLLLLVHAIFNSMRETKVPYGDIRDAGVAPSTLRKALYRLRAEEFIELIPYPDEDMRYRILYCK